MENYFLQASVTAQCVCLCVCILVLWMPIKVYRRGKYLRGHLLSI